MFITHTTILTSRAGLCAAWTPETLQTHCKRLMLNIFYHCHHVKSVLLFSLSCCTYSSHSVLLMSLLDICIVLSLCHMEHRCSYKDGCSLFQTFPLDTLIQDTHDGVVSIQQNQSRMQMSLKACLCVHPP